MDLYRLLKQYRFELGTDYLYRNVAVQVNNQCLQVEDQTEKTKQTQALLVFQFVGQPCSIAYV